MQHPGRPGQDAGKPAVAHRKTRKLEDQGREDCSIQAVLARMLRELMNQLGLTERLESLRARAKGLQHPGCPGRDAKGANEPIVAPRET